MRVWSTPLYNYFVLSVCRFSAKWDTYTAVMSFDTEEWTGLWDSGNLWDDWYLINLLEREWRNLPLYTLCTLYPPVFKKIYVTTNIVCVCVCAL